MIAALGLTAQLTTVARAVCFMFGELAGLLLVWAGPLWLGWRLRHNETAKSAIPWLRRGVGALMLVMGIAIIVRWTR